MLKSLCANRRLRSLRADAQVDASLQGTYAMLIGAWRNRWAELQTDLALEYRLTAKKS